MSETLFIADLHLTPTHPLSMKRCLEFLAGPARQASALYILGDLFEVWIGDDDDESGYQTVITALRQLTEQGVPVFVMVGNRDFLLGPLFSEMSGCQLLPDPTVIDLYGVPTLLTHGDSLCTADIAYQTFRQQVRQPSWQQHFLTQPLSQRRLLAQQARIQSQAYTQSANENIMDVTMSAVVTLLETQGVYRLIHGHTHRPQCHELNIGNQRAKRYVVGDWQQDEIIILKSTVAGCQLLKR